MHARNYLYSTCWLHWDFFHHDTHENTVTVALTANKDAIELHVDLGIVLKARSRIAPFAFHVLPSNQINKQERTTKCLFLFLNWHFVPTQHQNSQSTPTREITYPRLLTFITIATDCIRIPEFYHPYTRSSLIDHFARHRSSCVSQPSPPCSSLPSTSKHSLHSPTMHTLVSLLVLLPCSHGVVTTLYSSLFHPAHDRDTDADPLQPVTISLLIGPKQMLVKVNTVASKSSSLLNAISRTTQNQANTFQDAVSGSSFTWTPPISLTGGTYTLLISQPG